MKRSRFTEIQIIGTLKEADRGMKVRVFATGMVSTIL